MHPSKEAVADTASGKETTPPATRTEGRTSGGNWTANAALPEDQAYNKYGTLPLKQQCRECLDREAVVIIIIIIKIRPPKVGRGV